MGNETITIRTHKYVTVWLSIIAALLITLFILQKLSPTPLAPNQATLDAITHEAETITAIPMPSSTVTQTASATVTSITSTVTPTPPQTFKATVTQPSLCYNGPNESYLHTVILPADTEVDILGMNSDSTDWFMIDGETIDACWIKATFLSYNIDPEKILNLITAFTTEDSPCRIFPQEGRKIQTFVPKGWRIVINAKIVPKEDWVLVTPHDSTDQCWVATKHLTGFSDISLPPVLLSEALVVNNVPIPTSTRRGNNGGNDDPAPVQPTSVPPTTGPGTPVPPTSIPPTSAPPTSIPPTDTPQPTATLCWPPGKCK